MTKSKLTQLIGDELNIFLTKTHMTQRQLAKKIGISDTSLVHFVAPSCINPRIPGIKVINKILNYFGYEAQYYIKPIRLTKVDQFNKTHKLDFEEENQNGI